MAPIPQQKTFMVLTKKKKKKKHSIVDGDQEGVKC